METERGKTMAYIEMKHSYKRYQMGDTEIIANNDIFDIEKENWSSFLELLVLENRRF